MSRESLASLEVATISIPQRPEPPNELTSKQKDIWREITATKPPDWFEADTRPILKEYCRAIEFADKIARELDLMEGSVVDAKPLYELQEKNAKLLTQLATRMRLTPQSRYTPKAAATANKKSGPANKPWA